MDLWSFLEFILLLVVCAYLVNYYASPNVSLIVKVTSVLTWLFNFGLVLLVPWDILMVQKTFGRETK